MNVTLAPETLVAIDEANKDLLILTLFADERPLRGLNGLTDWRLNGRLSTLIQKEKLTGSKGETTLMTANERVGSFRVLLFGLGESADFDNRAFFQSVEELFAVTDGLKADSLAMNIPGAHKDERYLFERMAIVLKELNAKFPKEATLFVNRRHDFREMETKFDLLKSEIEKVGGETNH